MEPLFFGLPMTEGFFWLGGHAYKQLVFTGPQLLNVYSNRCACRSQSSKDIIGV